MTRLKIFLVSLLPQHLLSRIMLKLTHAQRLPFRLFFMHWYAKKYKLKMLEAVEETIENYSSINALFTRALKSDVRPINDDPYCITSPVDATVSQAGDIKSDTLYQAKNHYYSLNALLGGLPQLTAPFTNGKFATLYLSPEDYHRIHMPCTGTLRETIHIPGRLFSVAPDYVDHVPGLFARNERLVCIFDTEHGVMAVILVGAIFVSSIETVWAGTIVPPGAKRVSVVDYSHASKKITLNKGDELGRFNMGSTVIILHSNQQFEWQNLSQESKVVYGTSIARIPLQKSEG